MGNTTIQDWLRLVFSYIFLFVLCVIIGHSHGLKAILIIFVPFALFMTIIAWISFHNNQQK